MNKPYGNRYCKCGCLKVVEKTEIRNNLLFWADYIEGHENNVKENYQKRAEDIFIYEYNDLHKKAFELFGTNKCEICNIPEETYKLECGRRFDMHCISKDYSIMKKDNWMCLCRKCHGRLEYGYDIPEIYYPDNYLIIEEEDSIYFDL
jgi:hypothetical protein